MNPQMLFFLNQAIEFLERGDLRNAEIEINKAIDLNPNNFNAQHILGIIKGEQNELSASIEALSKAVKINAKDGVLQFNLAKALMKAERYSESLRHHNQATFLMKNNADVWINFGVSLMHLNRNQIALTCFEQSIKIHPYDAEAWSNKAMTLLALNRYKEALESCDMAIAYKPDYAEGWSNRGVVLLSLRQYKEALEAFDKAISFRKDYAVAWSNRGDALDHLKRYEEAIISYNEAISLNKNYFNAYWNKSLSQLVIGDFLNGWQNYEYRFKSTNINSENYKNLPKLTNLKNLSGKKLLVWSEQGYGDAIQFSRFTHNLLELGAKVYFEVHEPLKSLFKESYKNAVVISKDDSIAGIDYQIPLLSLPHLFSTVLTNIPSYQRYLDCTSESATKWDFALSLSHNKPNIGIACSGNQANTNDGNRSIPLDFFEPLSNIVNLFIIQKDMRGSDIEFLKSHPNIQFLGSQIQSFDDSAAIVEKMDFIVSVDTSLAHLSAALGKSTFILLPWAPEWRWLLDRQDSPWYPTALIFRQPKQDDWSSVLSAVTSHLKELFLKKI